MNQESFHDIEKTTRENPHLVLLFKLSGAKYLQSDSCPLQKIRHGYGKKKIYIYCPRCYPDQEEIAEKCTNSCNKCCKLNLDAPIKEKPIEFDEGLNYQVEDLLKNLSPRYYKIIKMRFGIGYKNKHSFDDIKVFFNVTRERIRQIEYDALKELKKQELRSKILLLLERLP